MKIYRNILLLCILFLGIADIKAAPFEIEGVIKKVRRIEVKGDYLFNGKSVISVYVVGHRFGKDFDFQYMVVEDSTQLNGISFEDLQPGKYVRIKSRAEPPGMVGKPLNEIRASRYNCCNYAVTIDTVKTPQSIEGKVRSVKDMNATNKIIEMKKSGEEYRYLVIDGKTKIHNGIFADITKKTKVVIVSASINIPMPKGVDHGALLGSDLFVKEIRIY